MIGSSGVCTLMGNQTSPIIKNTMCPQQFWAFLHAGGVGGNINVNGSPDGVNFLPVTTSPIIVSGAVPLDVTPTSYDTCLYYQFVSTGFAASDVVDISISGVA